MDTELRRASVAAILIAAALCAPAAAQQAPQPAAAPPTQAPTWDSLPRMQLERQYAGPLRDTVIQRWRDPTDGTLCYVYLPITAQHSPPTPSGFVQYGANTIGSISCLPSSVAPPAVRAAAPAPPAKPVVRP
jgi:hypothetical protein